MSDCKSAWITSCLESGSTHWGAIKSWNSFKGSKVKMINMKTSTRTSFKFNELKDELLICVTGKVKVYYGDQDLLLLSEGTLAVDYLEPGMALSVQSECPYRLEAVDNSVVIEVSAGQEGIVRLADDYGRETEKFSDYMNEIIERYWG